MLATTFIVVSLFATLELISAQKTNWTSPRAGDKPHIIMILIDDLGWANVGYHQEDPGVAGIRTPTIDRLATEEGLRLDQHYTGMVCGPSRASLMSGRLPIHVNVDNGEPILWNPLNPIAGYQGIPPAMTGVAEKLKQGNYATHHVGKWDAGMAKPEQTPLGRGFDTSFGYFHHDNDFYDYTRVGLCPEGLDYSMIDLWNNSGPAELDPSLQGEYEEKLFKDRVLDIIDQHPMDQPLFLYYAPHIVHTPLQVPDEYWKQFPEIENEHRRNYTAMLLYIDDAINEIVEKLVDKNMWDNTLVVFSSDNGGPLYPGGGANNYPLRGGKLSNWQGGIRVVAFVTGGYLPVNMRNTVKDGLVSLCDWYATFCELANVDANDPVLPNYLHDIDSKSMLNFITEPGAPSPRTEVALAPHYMNGIRIGGGGAGLITDDYYKILVGEITFSGWTGPIFPNETLPEFTTHDCGVLGCLFNIRDDPN
jgi:arylsulfatase I/J